MLLGDNTGGRSGFSVLDFGFQLDCLEAYTHTECMYTQYRLAKDLLESSTASRRGVTTMKRG